MSRLFMIVWLTMLWVVLWRDAHPVNIAGGAVVATLAVLLAPRSRPSNMTVRPLAALRFLGVFVVKLVEANFVLAREVLTPTNTIETGIVAVPLPGCSEITLTLTGNAVSLTPGTLTVEAHHEPEPVLFVHVLHLHDLDAARDEVLEIARLVRAAFEPEAVAS